MHAETCIFCIHWADRMPVRFSGFDDFVSHDLADRGLSCDFRRSFKQKMARASQISRWIRIRNGISFWSWQ